MSICPPEFPSQTPLQSPSSAPVSAAPYAPPSNGWTHSPELALYTDFLVNANLDLIGHRLDGLKRLYLFTRPQNSLPEDQVRSCATLLSLPFLRISKKIRTNLINAKFVAAGRSFNRYLACTKSVISKRLSEISEDEAADPTVRRLASAVKARTAAHLKVEHAELIDCELPAHLLPPEVDTEPSWMSNQYTPPSTPQANISAPIFSTAPAAAPPNPEPQHQPQTTPTHAQAPTAKSSTEPTATIASTPNPTPPATQSTTQVPITTPTNSETSTTASSDAENPFTPPKSRGKPFGMPNAKRGPFKKRRAA